MDKFAALTGRAYHLYDYVGAPDAERVIVLMCSGTDTVAGDGRRPGRDAAKRSAWCGSTSTGRSRRTILPNPCPPRSRASPCSTAPRSRARSASRCTSTWCAAVTEAVTRKTAPFAKVPAVIGGRYGLASKEFTPGMVKAVFDELAKPAPKNHFTVGINDDLTHSSLEYDPNFSAESDSTVRCIFWGVGSDGTVGANKNSIKIIGEETENLRPGLLRLRLAQIRLGDDLLPALRPAADPRAVADLAGQFPGLPPVLLPGAVRRAGPRSNPAGPSCSTASTSPRKSGIIFRAKPRNRSSTRNCAST